MSEKIKLGLEPDELLPYLLDFATKLKSIDNAYAQPIVYQLIETIPARDLRFSDLNQAQLAVVFKFFEEILPQVDADEYRNLPS